MADRIPNEPVEYMDVNTLWNDRRDPHANPTSRSPRRENGRADTNASGLTDLLKFLYRGPA